MISGSLGSGWGRSIVRGIWSNRLRIALAIITLTFIAAYEARNVTVDNSLTAWFAEGSEQLQNYYQFLDKFGSDDLVVVLLEREEGFATMKGTQILRQAVRVIDDVPGVGSTFSFLNLTDEIDKLPMLPGMISLKDLHETGQRLDFLLEDSLINGRLLSEDGRSTLILLRMKISDDINLQRDSLGGHLKKALVLVDARYATAGMSIIYAELNKLSRSESPRLLGLAILSMCSILLLSLRQIIPVLVALGSAFLATIWTFGFVGYTGGSINVLTSVVPTVILVIGVSTCVHIFLHLRSLPSNLSPSKRVVGGIAFMLQPCGFAAATTFVGFASLTLADLSMTREMGKLLAIGIAAVFVFVILNSIIAGKYVRPRLISRDIFSTLARQLATIGISRPKFTVLIFGLAGLIAVIGVQQIKVDAFPLELLPVNHPVRNDATRIEATVGPFTTLEFVVTAEDDVLQLYHLQAVDRWASSVVDNDLASWGSSLMDGIKRFYQFGMGGYPGIKFELPTDEEELKQILITQEQLAKDEIQAWSNLPHQMRVTFAIQAQSTSGLRRNLDAIMALAPTAGLQIEPVGLMPLWLSQVSTLVKSQIKSFAIALVLVMSIIVVMLRRLDLVILAVVVNLFPVLTTLGLMGISGVRLDLGTVAVASVILGLVVDDTIHYMYRLKYELKRENMLLPAIQMAASSSGHAIVISSIVISLGFGVLGFAQVTSVAWFGMLIGLATMSALVADLMLAPALLSLMNRSPRSS